MARFARYRVERDDSPFGVVLPEEGTARFDPFLVWHEQGPVNYRPREARGFPSHPHRGFETINYVIEGEQYHRDSTGHEGTIRAGDVQWMTAGAGVIHSELPTTRLVESGGPMHAFQIWVNLPRAQKMSPARYQELSAQRLPILERDGVWARIVAGALEGVQGPAQTVLPTTFVHVKLAPGAELAVPIPTRATTLVYAMRGDGFVDEIALTAPMIAASSEASTSVRVRGGDAGFEATLLAAEPIGEPVVAAGPFVMTSEDEIAQAYEDLRSGHFANAAAQVSVS